jgi:hypothetical protein
MADTENAGGGNQGHAPLPPLGASTGPSLADEERAIGGGGGRGTMLAAIVIFGLLSLAGLVFVLRSGGESEYSPLGRQLNGMRQEHFDAFWSCALPREDLRDLDGAPQVVEAVTRNAHSSPHGYATLVRTTCMTHLDEHAPLLSALIVPPDMHEGMSALTTALRSLHDAWAAYLTYLEGLPGAYDAEDAQAVTLVTAVARGWYDYKLALGTLNDVIRTHVTEE